MKILFVLLVLIALIGLAAAAAKRKRNSPEMPAKAPSLAAKSALMDKWEAELYERLVVALKASHVFPQVAMSAFVKEAERRSGGRNAFAQKYVDFLVCARGTLKPLYVIELDGRSHSSARAKEKDGQRDAMLASAGIPVKRYTSSKVDFTLILRDYLEVVDPARAEPKLVVSPGAEIQQP